MKYLPSFAFLVCSALIFSGCSSVAPTGPELIPTAHTDFSHDTLALTWQPGFCASGSGCLPDQPHDVLIGLHGIWASEPHTLEARGVPVQQWWARGCDLYDADDAPPVLQQATLNGIERVMPHLRNPLHVHEYTKHARCFGYGADTFFATAMALRDRLDVSPFGVWLRARAGYQLSRDDVLAMFARLSGATAPRALQLRCERSGSGAVVLSQLWFTLDPKRLSAFPDAASYVASPNDQNGCPDRFFVPNWGVGAAAQRP